MSPPFCCEARALENRFCMDDLTDDVPCGRCGFPLPHMTPHHVVRDDSDPAVVAAVLDGSIHRLDCPRCGATGWLSTPLLWVDRVQRRAVYSAPEALRNEQHENFLHVLLERALHDVPAEVRETILRRVQRVKYPFEICEILRVPAGLVAVHARAQDAFHRREALPLRQRFDQAIADGIAIGASHSEGRELSPEFVALGEAELATIAEDDRSVRAEVVRALVAKLRLDATKQSPVAVPAPSTSDLESLNLVSEIAVLLGRARDPESTPAVRIAALSDLATAHINAGHYEEGYAAARDLVDNATNANDARGRADGLVLAGVALSRAGHPEAAVNYLIHGEQEQHALALCDAELMALGAEAGGDALMQLRDYPGAKHAYSVARDWCERMRRPDAVRTVLSRLADACQRMGETREAIAICRRILDLCDEESLDGVSARLSLAVALASGLAAGISTLDEVVREYESAHRGAVHMGAHSLALSAKDGIANAYLEERRTTEAREVLEESVRVQEALGIPIRAHTLVSLGSVWELTAADAWDAGAEDDARNMWEQALAFFEHGGRASDGGYATHEEIVFGATRGQAICLEALGRHAEARICYRQAIGMFEGGRQHLTERQHKMFVQSRSMILFRRAQRNNLALYVATQDESLLKEAFYFAEAGRSRILLDLLGTDSAARPVTSEAIAEALPDGTALIQYSLVPTYANCTGGWAIYLVLPGTGLTRVAVRQDLDEVLHARNVFHAELDRFDRNPPNDYAGCDAALERIGALLLPGDLLTVLRDHGVERIVFAPDDYLFDMPFAALRVRWAESIDDLCHSGIETIVVPSASAYIAAGKHHRVTTSKGSLLCISDPQRDLPGVSEWIADNILREWTGPVEHLKGEHATIANVLAALPRARAVLYFGHGTKLGLELYSGVLTMRELSSLELDCDLFVALACFGAHVTTDDRSRELLGLSAALLQAGVRNFVSGVWPLLPRFAMDFGSRLMRYVAENVPIGIAQLNALNYTRATNCDWNHPYVWAGVRLAGRGEANR